MWSAAEESSTPVRWVIGSPALPPTASSISQTTDARTMHLKTRVNCKELCCERQDFDRHAHGSVFRDDRDDRDSFPAVKHVRGGETHSRMERRKLSHGSHGSHGGDGRQAHAASGL